MQPDFNQMMRNVGKLQQAMQKVQDELTTAIVEGSSGGGVVKVSCTGTMEFKSVKINKEAVDPADVETLEDLVLMAIKDACDKAKDMGQKKMSQAAGGLPLPPGLGF